MMRRSRAERNPPPRPLSDPARSPTVSVAMLSYAFVDGFTRAPRHEAIARMKAAIVAAGGVIVDFAFFMDGAVRLSVEIEAGAVGRLADALVAEGVQLFDRCTAELSKARDVVPSWRPVTAMLHVTLLDDREVGAGEARG